MKKTLLLFDVDGTLVESGQKINDKMADILKEFKNNNKYELGIVGGGKLDKILNQFDGKISFDHYFTECGSVYYKEDLTEIYRKDIRENINYLSINNLIKVALKFLSNVDYVITGNFIDLRSGLIYISLIGLSANEKEREYFMIIDKTYSYRKQLFDILINEREKMNLSNEIDIVYGGSVGIAIYPKIFDKIQILDNINKNEYKEIHYFGDKYLEGGNDHNLINHQFIIGHPVDNINETYNILKEFL